MLVFFFPEGPARHLDASRQKLTPHCLAAIFDLQLPSPKLSLKMPPKFPLPHKRGLFFFFHNCPAVRVIGGAILVVRIARPTSLAIWHRGRSHRRPNRNGSPNRKHFASLDLKKHADFSHRRPTSQNFRRRFFWHFPVISDQAFVFSNR